MITNIQKISMHQLTHIREHIHIDIYMYKSVKLGIKRHDSKIYKGQTRASNPYMIARSEVIRITPVQADISG